MAGNKAAQIRIDLNQFKLHIHIPTRIELSLHFDSPSRKFYLAVIGLVVKEMKCLGKIASIPMENHCDVLALLNDTVGGQAGSSERENLLPRIYRKWKDALPDLEHAPLFRVLGRKKEFEDSIGKTYRFTDEEKDNWANLFEYKGSHENVRLRFSVDNLGATLDDVVINWGPDPDLSDEQVWHGFVESFRQVADDPLPRANGIRRFLPGHGAWRRRPYRTALACVMGLVVVGVIIAIGYFSFHLLRPASESAFTSAPAYPLPDKPSIAVLPFNNLSGDPEQEYFSDGLTEEIITALSKMPKLFVIARYSTFSYKGKPVKINQIAEELGVGYILEGSVRKTEDRVRITVQLIDALSGHHLWAERYDRDLKDIFVLQDDITMKIINALQVELTEGEHARLWGKGTDNLQAYLKSLRARELYLAQTKEGNALARRTAEEAIALDPEYAPPYHVLSITHFMDILFRTTKSPDQSMTRAVELIQKAIALDDSYALAHGWLGFLYAFLRKHEESIMEAQKGVALDPNGAHGYLYLNIALRFAGRFEEAIEAIEKAIRLNPFPPSTYFRFACGTNNFVGRYEEAIAAGKKAVTISPNEYQAHMLLAAAYSLSGRQEEARSEAEEVLRLNPKFSVVFWGKTLPFKNKADLEHYLGALRKAGLPE